MIGFVSLAGMTGAMGGLSTANAQLLNGSFEQKGVEPGMLPSWDGWAEKLAPQEMGITPTDGDWVVSMATFYTLEQRDVVLGAGDHVLVDIYANVWGAPVGEDALFTVWLSASGAYEDRTASIEFPLQGRAGAWSTLDLLAPAPGSYTLYFEQFGLSEGKEIELRTFVDNVRVTPIPTPGSVGLFAAAGLIVARRRRSA